MTSGVLMSHLAYVHVDNGIQNVAFGYWGDCQICDLDSVKSVVLKTHPADLHVYNYIQNLVFGYWGNWWDCLCDLGALNNHSVDEHVHNGIKKHNFWLLSKLCKLLNLWSWLSDK